MIENKSAVIIGAGVGGIATAISLARNGYKVKVYEKNSSPGGRCGQLIRDGHRFDLGATIFLMPGIYREVFESLGLKLEDCFTVKPLPVIYKLFFDDGHVFSFTTNEKDMKSQLEAMEPGSSEKFQIFISRAYQMYKWSLDGLLGRNFYSLFDFINLKNVRLLFRIKTHIRHITYVGKFFKHPYLKVAFTFQNIYVGQDPFKSPALFSILPALELTEGPLFPIGGMYSIVEKLISTATS
ncbi:MAG TPA: FAD-dependent oxidoreductase, partial [Bacteroidales bacterium]